MRLQYLAGMWLNSDMGDRIVSSILAYYRFPDQTFVGSPEGVDALKQALDQERTKEGPKEGQALHSRLEPGASGQPGLDALPD